MLLASAPDDPTGMGIAKSSGLRDMLKEATATAHRDLDAKFAAFDLPPRLPALSRSKRRGAFAP
jgi:hypothetical protein